MKPTKFFLTNKLKDSNFKNKKINTINLSNNNFKRLPLKSQENEFNRTTATKKYYETMKNYIKPKTKVEKESELP